jgi:sec-independent protein translocase protein TatA
MTTFAFGMPGPFELILVLVIVLIFFGIGKLPKVLGQMGKGMRAFKDGMGGDPNAGLDESEIDITPDAPPALAENPAPAVEEADEVPVPVADEMQGYLKKDVHAAEADEVHAAEADEVHAAEPDEDENTAD